VLADAARLVISEWTATVIYFCRDVNSLEWELECRLGNSIIGQDQVQFALQQLFMLRRRITKYKGLVDKQRSICASPNSASWASCGNEAAAAKVRNELLADYDQLQQLINDTIDKIEPSIRFLNAQMVLLQGRQGLDEAKTSRSQNRMLMVLTFVATFFLPFNAIAAILNISGDFAPGGSGFGIFWASAIPVSVLLVLALFAMSAWNGDAPLFHLTRKPSDSGATEKYFV
jgi:Mg2+ and Co2+ transporter CorA